MPPWFSFFFHHKGAFIFPGSCNTCLESFRDKWPYCSLTRCFDFLDSWCKLPQLSSAFISHTCKQMLRGRHCEVVPLGWLAACPLESHLQWPPCNFEVDLREITLSQTRRHLRWHPQLRFPPPEWTYASTVWRLWWEECCRQNLSHSPVCMWDPFQWCYSLGPYCCLLSSHLDVLMFLSFPNCTRLTLTPHLGKKVHHNVTAWML